MAEHNFPAFDHARDVLQGQGFRVISPADLTRDTWAKHKGEMGLHAWLERTHQLRTARNVYLANDIPQLLSCSNVVLLRGWGGSRGATLEALVAVQMGLPLWYFDHELGTLKPQPVESDGTYYYAMLHASAECSATMPDAEVRCVKKNAVLASPEPAETRSTLAEADAIINGPRQESYGHPLDNFAFIADFWSQYLRSKYREGFGHHMPMNALEPEDIALMMDLLKVAREAGHPSRDNRVDGPGYWGCLDLIVSERARRAKESTA